MAKHKKTPQAPNPDRVAYAIRIPRKHFEVIKAHAKKAGQPIAEEIRQALNSVYGLKHVAIERGGNMRASK